MKNDRNKMDLDQLLATLEHAGRDNRRQQELGAMIDSLAAAEETPKRGFWWWSSRVAATACVTFFVTTAVRIWFIPTGHTTKGIPTVAEVTVTETPTATVSDTAILPAVSHSATSHTPNTAEAQPTAASEELYAEEAAEPVEEDSIEAPYYIIEDDFAPDTEQLADNSEPEQAITDKPAATPDTDTPNATKSAAPQRRKLLGGFLRRSEPSRMEGTTLALLQF